jgi:hypothetical protein
MAEQNKLNLIKEKINNLNSISNREAFRKACEQIGPEKTKQFAADLQNLKNRLKTLQCSR